MQEADQYHPFHLISLSLIYSSCKYTHSLTNSSLLSSSSPREVLNSTPTITHLHLTPCVARCRLAVSLVSQIGATRRRHRPTDHQSQCQNRPLAAGRVSRSRTSPTRRHTARSPSGGAPLIGGVRGRGAVASWSPAARRV